MGKHNIINGEVLIKKAVNIGNGRGFIIPKDYPTKIKTKKFYKMIIRELSSEEEDEIKRSINNF